jgi:hypothetical protein
MTVKTEMRTSPLFVIRSCQKLPLKSGLTYETPFIPVFHPVLCLSGVGNTTSSAATTWAVEVPSTAPWFDTGIDLTSGQLL